MAQKAAGRAAALLFASGESGNDLNRWLLDRCACMGYVVRFRPQAHTLLGASVRATIDLQTHIVEIFQPALDELAARLPLELRRLALPLVLAHELFHALDSKSSEPELAAHLFAARVCDCPIFPGLLDLPPT